MNIFEISKILKENPGMVAKSNKNHEIYFNDKESVRSICNFNLGGRIVLTEEILEANWEIQDQEVDFMIAFKAWQNDNREIYSKGDKIYNYYPQSKSRAILPKEIKEYKWYIKYIK